MSAPTLVRPGPPDVRGTVALDVVVPVYNEEQDLEPSVRRLRAHLDTLPWPARITIADNASTDATPALSRRLAAEIEGVRAVRLEAKGRGRALKAVWSTSDADVLVYMDVDLSTDLSALLPLVAPLVSGHSDVAIGTRLGRGARVVRGPKREVISRCYNVLLRGTLRTGFSDAQCGFKAIRSDVARRLLPLVHDDGWFFDTELLVLAERAGLRIHEVPVDWIDDPDSRVDVLATAVADLKGIVRVGRALATGAMPLHEVRAGTSAAPGGASDARLTRQLLRFAIIGVASTLAYVLVYAALRTALPAQASNLLALLLTAVANTAANRRYTFGVSGRRAVVRHQFQGLAVFAAALALTSGSLELLHVVDATPSRSVEVAVLVLANAAATAARFLLLRSWVFGARGEA